MSKRNLETETIKNCVAAYKPMLDRMTLSAKVEMYNVIYSNVGNATDEMLSLGVAITADPEFQGWMNSKLMLPKP